MRVQTTIAANTEPDIPSPDSATARDESANQLIKVKVKVTFTYITPHMPPSTSLSSQTETAFSLSRSSQSPRPRTSTFSHTATSVPQSSVLTVSAFVIHVNTRISTHLPTPRDGRLSCPGWLTHSGQFTHKVVTC